MVSQMRVRSGVHGNLFRVFVAVLGKKSFCLVILMMYFYIVRNWEVIIDPKLNSILE